MKHGHGQHRNAGDWRGLKRGHFAFVAAPGCVVVLAVLTVGAALKTSDQAPTRLAARSGTTAISEIFTPEVQFWTNAIADWASEAGVDPNLAAVVMQIESCGNPLARSAAGAVGLFQVMPYHFAATEDPLAPSANARRALEYLKQSLAAAHGDPRLALAGYNGGIGVISEAEWNWPAETQRYSSWAGAIYKDAISGAASSRSLAEWLGAGGADLCQSARETLSSGY
jgi:soluble lytic murein transglycosylase-like protein